MIRLLDEPNQAFSELPGYTGIHPSVEAVNRELTWLQELKQKEAEKAEAKRIELVNLLLDTMDRSKTRNSNIYEVLTPVQWAERFKRKNVLEAFTRIPFGIGEMTPEDVNNIHDLLIALAYGKHNVPFILTLQANEDRKEWVSAHLIEDTFFGKEKEQLIQRPDHKFLSGEPAENVRGLRKLTLDFLNREHSTITKRGGLLFTHAMPEECVFPGVVAIAGTHDASFALGGLKLPVQGNYKQIL